MLLLADQKWTHCHICCNWLLGCKPCNLIGGLLICRNWLLGCKSCNLIGDLLFIRGTRMFKLAQKKRSKMDAMHAWRTFNENTKLWLLLLSEFQCD